VQEIADALVGVDKIILIKNPVNPDLALWIGAVERIKNAGIKRIGVIHRGFSTYQKQVTATILNGKLQLIFKIDFHLFL